MQVIATVNRRAGNATLPIAIAAMNACWIYIAARLLDGAVLSGSFWLSMPSPVWLAALMLLAWWISALLLEHTLWPLYVVQAIAGVLGVAASLGVTVLASPIPRGGIDLAWASASIYGLVLCLIAWFYGGYRASERFGFNQAYTDLRTGLIVVAASALTAIAFGAGRTVLVWADLGVLPIWFFGWSLVALALGNREVVREESGSAGLGARAWSLVLVVSIGVVLLAGALVGLLDIAKLLTMLSRLITGAMVFLGTLFFWLISGAFWLMSLPRLLLPNAPPPKPEEPKPLGDTSAWLKRLQESFRSGNLSDVPPGFLTAITVIVLVLLTLFAIWLVTRGLRRTRRRDEKDAVEERESLGPWSLFRQQFAAWVRRLLGRFRPAAQIELTSAEDDLAALQGRPEYQGTLTVRQIYAHMLALTGSVGYPRSPQQTPVEYLRVLGSAIPRLHSEFEDITAAYLEARYGPMPVPPHMAMAAGDAWRHVEPVLKSAAAERTRA